MFYTRHAHARARTHTHTHTYARAYVCVYIYIWQYTTKAIDKNTLVVKCISYKLFKNNCRVITSHKEFYKVSYLINISHIHKLYLSGGNIIRKTYHFLPCTAMI